MGCSGCGMWYVRDMECSGLGMFGMWDVRDLECSRCGMFGVWDVRDVRCGMFGGMWDIDLQNANYFLQNDFISFFI